MASLDDLIRMDGVMVACEFTSDGHCKEFKSHIDMSSELVERASQYIATVTMMFDTLASAFSGESHMSWTPQQGWTYSGGDWTVLTGDYKAVFAQTEKADIAEIMKVLIMPRKASQIEQSM